MIHSLTSPVAGPAATAAIDRRTTAARKPSVRFAAGSPENTPSQNAPTWLSGWKTALTKLLPKKTAGKKPVSGGMLTTYPPIEPFRTRMLQVSPLHKIYVEESGNPDGFPVIFLHGGPAAGLGERYRQFFNPAFFHIIGFDQRGCEKSAPLGELRENTVWDLVEDIQRIRRELGVENKRYLIFGGSWGSLLSLAAAETHPEDVAGVIIRGISLGRPEDTAWATKPGQGVYSLYPEAGDYWTKGMEGHEFDDADLEAGRDPAMGIYDRLFNDPGISEEERLRAVKYWRLGSTLTTGDRLAGREQEKPLEEYRDNLNTAKIVCRYYYRNAFMDPPDQLLRNVDRLKDIPYIFITNGREDLQTPPTRAYELYKAMQAAGIGQARLKIVEDAGHSAWNPKMTHELMNALHEFEALNRPE